MSQLPYSIHKAMSFENGSAIGISNRWHQGQYCSILTKIGIVGCGIYDIETPSEFGQAIAIAKGTPENPLCDPEDLLEAEIVDLTPRAKEIGIALGDSGKVAVEKMLIAGNAME